MLKLTAFLALNLVLAASAHAQVMHLAPVPRQLSSSTTILQITRDTFPKEGRLRIHDGMIYIIRPDRITRFELEDRTIMEFIRDFPEDVKGLKLSTDYPELSVSEFPGDTIFEFDSTDVVKIQVRHARPQVAAALGVAFTANEVRSTDESSALMRNAGLDLDVVGTKPFDLFTLRVRVGFHSAEPVPSDTKPGTETEEPEAPSAEQTDTDGQTDPRAVIEAAQAVVVGLNVDVPLPAALTFDASQVHLSAGLDISQYWASPEAYLFPAVLVDDEPTPVDQVFSADLIARAREELDRVAPLRTALGGVRMLFGSRDRYVFYLMADYGQRQYLLRRFGVRYTVTPPTGNEPAKRTPTAILTRYETPWESITRLALGIRLTEDIDFKLDVITPFEARPTGPRAQPLLRIMIGTPGVRFGR